METEEKVAEPSQEVAPAEVVAEGVEHVITQEDLEVNPELKGEVAVGETVVLPPLNEVISGSAEAELVEKLDKMADIAFDNLPEAPKNSKEFIENGKRYRKYTKEDGSSGPCWLLDENGLEVEKVS